VSTGERFLVTGALGCIGAWTCAELAAAGVEVVGFDLGADDRRVRLATEAEIPLVHGDISDREAVTKALDDHGITHVIHLAALLIPSIKRDPPYGTAVNIGGSSFSATSRPSLASRARYTSPIPPAPSGATISYGPSFVPAVRAIRAGNYIPKNAPFTLTSNGLRVPLIGYSRRG